MTAIVIPRETFMQGDDQTIELPSDAAGIGWWHLFSRYVGVTFFALIIGTL